MYRAQEIAEYVVNKCIADGCPISNLQLQKILYFVQKDYLKRGERAFTDAIEAWKFGPVVPDVYYYYSGFGAMLIDMERGGFEPSARDKSYIDPIVESKREREPWDLVEETHKPGGAWERTYNSGLGMHKEIDINLIRNEDEP